MSAYELFKLIEKHEKDGATFCLSKSHWRHGEGSKRINFQLWIDRVPGKLLESATGWKNLYEQYLDYAYI